MHIIYLDESGDSGRKGSPTGIYLIAGLSIDSAKWAECYQLLANFRKQVFFRHKLDPSCEMHANEFLGAAQSHLGLGRVDRLAIARAFIDVIASLPEARTFGWFVNKDMSDPLERVALAASNDLDVWSSSDVFGRYTDGYLIIHDTFGHRPAIWRAEFAPPRIS